MHGGCVYLVYLYRDNLFQLLDAALHLHGLGGLVPETLNEVFDIGYLFLLVLIRPELLFTPLCSQHHIFVIFHFIVDDLLARYFQSSGTHLIDESPIMADKHH